MTKIPIILDDKLSYINDITNTENQYLIEALYNITDSVESLIDSIITNNDITKFSNTIETLNNKIKEINYELE